MSHPRTDAVALEEIHDLFRQWKRAIASKDVDTLVSLTSADAEFWTHAAPPLKGRDAIRATFESFFAGYDFQQDFEFLEVIVTESHAFVRGTEVNRLHPVNGQPDMEVRQRAFMVIRKDDDGRWRFARGMTNLPPAAAPSV